MQIIIGRPLLVTILVLLPHTFLLLIWLFLMICPLLLDYVWGEVEREASLAKNLRKAREEREAARAKDKKDKKDNG